MRLDFLDPVLGEDVGDGGVLLGFLDVGERVKREEFVGF